MNYRIAIPSYRRAPLLRRKTLAFLARHDINPQWVTVFVADAGEREIYERELKGGPYRHIIVAEPGLAAARRFIQRYYAEGTPVLSLDDDVDDILRRADAKHLAPIASLERDVVQRGFAACIEHRCGMFGVYAAANAMFMKPRIAVGLYYCIGSCWGTFTRHSEEFAVTLTVKEDYQRTLQHFCHDGAVVRLDDLTVKTRYYTEAGGLHGVRTMAVSKECCDELVRRYPSLVTTYVRRGTGRAELRLHAPRG